MKNLTFLLFSIGGVLLSNCKNNQSSPVTNPPHKIQEKQDTSFTGMFTGIIPCADCPGISTHITFNKNGQVAKSTLYLESDETSLTEYGTWKRNNQNIEVSLDNAPKEYYAIKNTTTLVMLDMNKKEVTGAMAKHYVFKKEQVYSPKNLNGVYHTSTHKKGYNQILQLTALNDSIYQVKITFKGATKGCAFQGTGTLVNNQIDVALNKINKNLKATMTIQFKDNGNKADLFTSRFNERYDLNYFCGGGASLAGTYIKQ